jgi:hypothetical protein
LKFDYVLVMCGLHAPLSFPPVMHNSQIMCRKNNRGEHSCMCLYIKRYMIC